MTKTKHLLLVLNVDWFFLSHYKHIGIEAMNRGYKVTVTAMEEENRGHEIKKLGFDFIPIPGSRGNTNPLIQLRNIFFLFRLYKRLNPDIVHHFSIKNNLYGSIASRITKVPKVINSITGLGSLFYKHHKVFLVLKHLLRYVFMFGFKTKHVKNIFQNKSDKNYFRAFLGLNNSQMFIVPGAGVNLQEFEYSPEPPKGPVKVVLASRLLKDKGILEFERAAGLLKRKYGDKIEFVLAGKLDPENKTGITRFEIDQIQKRGNIKWIGNVNDMPDFYKKSHIISLPSYREGLSKSLIEACAIGRPIVTTDTAGCRDIIDKEKNGFLVPVGDHVLLAEKIEQLYSDEELRKKMGVEGRKMAEEKFGVEKIIDQVFSIYES